MKAIKVVNKFHNTECNLRIKDNQVNLTENQMCKIRNLCPDYYNCKCLGMVKVVNPGDFPKDFEFYFLKGKTMNKEKKAKTKKKSKMTELEILEKIKECIKNDDPEEAHGDGDDLLCEYIKCFGGKLKLKIINEYNKISKWYV